MRERKSLQNRHTSDTTIVHSISIRQERRNKEEKNQKNKTGKEERRRSSDFVQIVDG
jgi:hypothetical protein